MSNLTSYAYDPANRLQTITYPGTGGTVTYAYFPNGLRQSMTDPTGATTYAYNTANGLTSCYQPVPNWTVSYTYDDHARRRTMQMGYQTWTSSYDYANRLTALDCLGGYAHYTYTDNGLVSDRLNGNWSEAAYSYDNRGRVTHIAHSQHSNGFVFKDLYYDYDPAGNVTRYRDYNPGETNTPSWTVTYTYDPADRLLQEQRVGATGVYYDNTLSYAYDNNGNRTQVSRIYNWGSQNWTYATDANDKTTFGEGFTFTYNSNGDPTRIVEPYRGTMNQTYDYESRLLSMSYGNGTPTSYFRYNADGQRVEKIDSQGTTRYIYDGSTIIGETDGNNGVLYYHLPGVGVHIANTGAIDYYQDNGIGSTTMVVDPSINRIDWYMYDAYGVTDVLRQNQYTPYKFGGKHGYYTDGDSGMILLGHRYYMPELGKFLTQDPKGHEAGLNLYQYANQNPLVNIDPTGMDTVVTRRGNTLVVTSNLILYGPEATTDNMARITTGIKGLWQVAADYYAANFSSTYDVQFVINARLATPADYFRGTTADTIELVPGLGRSHGGRNFRSIPGTGYLNYRLGRGMIWYVNKGRGTWAHEFGHLLGIRDHYHDVIYPNGNTVSIPDKDWGGTMMGEKFYSVVERPDLNELLGAIRANQPEVLRGR